MTIFEFTFKTKRRLWYKLVAYFRNKSIYKYLYRSFWHYKFSKTSSTKNTTCYYSARPNPGAGIGHQMANWIAGYWFSKQFELKFAHFPFSNSKWESFLGFGEAEAKVDELIAKGYIKKKLPLFNENDTMEVDQVKAIIRSYSGNKVVFIAEQDQFYHDQYGVMEQIKQKFHNAKSRQTDQLIYLKENFNIAIHVRRGDIILGKNNRNPNFMMRWQDTDYFAKVLSTVVENLETEKTKDIYLFSQGKQTDFKDFEKFDNIHYCLDMDALDSFCHMVYADLLITSKSSFSYKPALLSNGIKVCPKDFWHEYPDRNDWILAENDGTFDVHLLKSAIESMLHIT